MATLQKIRNRAGLLIIVIGIAMLAFILGDFLSGNKGSMGRSSMMIAKIDGSNVYQKEYFSIEASVSKFYELLYGLFYGQSTINEQISQRARTQAWDDLLSRYILTEEYNEIGLGVTNRELYDQFTGNNPHPLIRNLFSDPQTGIFQPQSMIQFLQTTEPDNQPDNLSPQDHERLEMFRSFRKLAEEQVENDRLKTKYNNLFNKGLYVTNLEAKNFFEETNSRAGFRYVAKKFTSVPDSLIKVTEKDLEKYYRENIHNYMNKEETRTLEYVTFEVIPTEADDEAAKEEINKILPEFEEATDVESFLRYIGSDAAYDATNHSKDELPEIYRDVLFDAPVGTTYGPYFENDAYKIAKVAKVNYIPDSVKARHILIGTQQQQRSFQDAKAIADSLTDLIKNGLPFAQLAEGNSDDKGSAMVGGDLGWFGEGQMVQSFNDTCFYGKKGDLKQAYSQFGIHIIEVQDQSRKVRKVQIGVAERKVVPGSETIDEAYRKAMLFAGENRTYEDFKAAVDNDPSLVKRQAMVNKNDMSLYNMPESRKLIQWAYVNEVGNVSETALEINENYLVLSLKEVNEKGEMPFEKVRELVKLEVIKEKKSEIIKQQMEEALASKGNLDQVSLEIGAQVVEAGEMSLGNKTPMLSNGSLEPKVLAVAGLTREGEISKPVVGNDGVYIVQTNTLSKPGDVNNADIGFSKMQLERSRGTRVDIASALKDEAEVQDKRFNFF